MKHQKMNITASLRGDGKEATGATMYSAKVAILLAREEFIKRHGSLPRVEHWKIYFRGVEASQEEVANLLTS